MKRITIFLLFFITILSLSSCNGNSAHTHDYSSGWETNETHHWKACLEEGCDSIVAISEHSFSEGADLGNGNTKYTCTVCSYEKTEVHNHIFATDFTRTETEHYYECSFEGCYAKNAFAEHSYGAPSFDGKEEIYICAQCGYEDKRTHTHSHTGVLVATEDGHFYSCVLPLCVSKGELLPHDWSEPSLVEGLDVYVCSVCKHTKTQTHEHNSFTDWQRDDNSHWKKCNTPDCNYIEFQEPHSWVSDGVIKQPTPNESGEEKFICEVCGLTKIKDIEYIPPKMTEDEWVSYFVFDNLKLKNTYSIGTDEFTDIWLIDGENILITSDESSSYGSVSDLMSFSFLVNCYDSFAVVTEGEYFADEIEYYDSEFEEDVTYKNVRICFSDAKILKIEFQIELGILGTMTETYDFIEWGGVVVPDNPREVVSSPESISQMFGNSLENFKMTETVIFEGDTTYSEYCFDGDRYSTRTDGEDAVSGVMSDAGATVAISYVGFFYCLNEERFTLDVQLSDESTLVYVYGCGITVDGLEYDSVTVTLVYENEDLLEIAFSYTVDLFGTAKFEYVFSDFGAAVVEGEIALIHELAGKSVKQVSAMLNVYDGSQNIFSSYYFDYSDYFFTIMDSAQTVATLKDSAAVYISNWLGTLPEIDSTEFLCVEDTSTSKIYSTSSPVTSCGVTYASTRVNLAYEGNDRDGYEIVSIEIAFGEGENGEDANYYFYNFGTTYVSAPDEEEREIPADYITELIEGASLLNYKLAAYEMYFLDGEYLTESNLMYEFDSHKGRFYKPGNIENAEYVSEDYVGMSYATDVIGLLAQLDPSGFTLVSDKSSGKSHKIAYEYVGNAVIGEITLKNIAVHICYEGAVLTSVDIYYTMSISTDLGDSLANLRYLFYSFGEATVVLPEDETVVKFGYERFDVMNYEYTTAVSKAGSESFSAAGRYDDNTYYESNSENGDNYGYTENVGLRDFLRNFGWMIESFSIDELVYSARDNYMGYDTAVIYTCSTMKQLRAPIGNTYHDIIAASFKFTFFYEGSELSKIVVEYIGMIEGVSYEISSTLSGFGEQSVVVP